MMKKLKHFGYRIPVIRALHKLWTSWAFSGSRTYWETRYARGGNSGVGSYGRLALFKAEFINSFVQEHDIRSIVEFGCGDGNQLSLANYPSYVGLDVSRTAIAICGDRFKDDVTKRFFLYERERPADGESTLIADLALSLDVIYHLIEDETYHRYMTRLFEAARRFVIIYSSNQAVANGAVHVRHRRFTDWVSEKAVTWRLRMKLDNKYPFDPLRPDDTSISDFYVFEKIHEDVVSPCG
jgi:SAM-dependent methyltransferase